MGTLSYTATMSLDGCVADAEGDFQWSGPNDEVFQLHLDRMAEVSTEVLGRRTYQLMTYWEAEPPGEHWGDAEREFARHWCAIEKVVVSSTLSPDVLMGRSRLVPSLDLADLARIVDEAPGEVEIFGPTTAAADLVGASSAVVGQSIAPGTSRAALSRARAGGGER